MFTGIIKAMIVVSIIFILIDAFTGVSSVPLIAEFQNALNGEMGMPDAGAAYKTIQDSPSEWLGK